MGNFTDFTNNIFNLVIIIFILLFVLKYVSVGENFKCESDLFTEGPYATPIKKYAQYSHINGLYNLILNKEIGQDDQGNKKYLTVLMNNGYQKYRPLGQYVKVSDAPLPNNYIENLVSTDSRLYMLRYSNIKTTYVKIGDSTQLSGYVGDYFTIWKPSCTDPNLIYLGDLIWMGGKEPPSDAIVPIPIDEAKKLVNDSHYWMNNSDFYTIARTQPRLDIRDKYRLCDKYIINSKDLGSKRLLNAVFYFN